MNIKKLFVTYLYVTNSHLRNFCLFEVHICPVCKTCHNESSVALMYGCVCIEYMSLFFPCKNDLRRY